MGGTCDTARPTTCAGTANGNVAPEGHPNYAYVREDSVLSKLDLAALLGTLGDAVTAIETSDPDDKAVVYASLGLTVTFDPLAQTLVAECDIDTAAWGKRSCRRGT